MTTKTIIRSAITVLMVTFMAQGVAAQDDQEQSIISEKVGIKKYHDREDLLTMHKGELLDLYVERIDVIIKILPNIAFTTKPGVTMSDLGIPDTKEHRKALSENIEATSTYFENTLDFQKLILPYSDKYSLISAVLFYEQTIKSLHTYNDFN